MGALKRLLNLGKCQHNWEMEEPTYNIGDTYKEWYGQIYDYCTKCGAKRTRPECQHRWQPAQDDGSGSIIYGKKMIRTAICTKCGAQKYETPKKKPQDFS